MLKPRDSALVLFLILIASNTIGLAASPDGPASSDPAVVRGNSPYRIDHRTCPAIRASLLSLIPDSVVVASDPVDLFPEDQKASSIRVARNIPIEGIHPVRRVDTYWDGAFKGLLAGGISTSLFLGMVFSALDDDPGPSDDNNTALEGMAYGAGIGGVVGATLGAVIDAALGGPPQGIDKDDLREGSLEGRERGLGTGWSSRVTVGPFYGFANATDWDNSRQWRPFIGGRIGYESISRLVYEFYLAGSRERDGEKISFFAANALVPLSLGGGISAYYSSGFGMMRVETPYRWGDGSLSENFADVNIGGGFRWRTPKLDRARVRLEYRWHPIPDRYHEISLGASFAIF